MLSTVIFDIDNTLVDSKRIVVDYYRRMFEALGRSFPEGEDQAFYKLAEPEIYARFFQDPSIWDKAKVLKNQMNFDDLTRRLRLMPYARETLDALSGKVRMAVATNRESSVFLVLENFKLSHYFEAVASLMDVKTPKPAPDMMVYLLDTMGVSAEETLFVGDAETDAQSARAAGVKSLLVGSDHDGNADYLLPDLKPLPDLVERLMSEGA